MHIYFLTAGAESGELDELEQRIRTQIPDLVRLAKLDMAKPGSAKPDRPKPDSAAAVRSAEPWPGAPEPDFVIFPVLTASASLDALLSIVEQHHPNLFFIFVSREISASDYKRLVRSGRADWVSLQGAPREIEDIIVRARTPPTVPAPAGAAPRPAIAAFVPSAGGVGNTTLALESAVRLKQEKRSKKLRICLLDLDLQTSHVCDHLDIEPRLQIEELVDNPGRLDAQLFELFISHHASGLDVLAAPRERARALDLNTGVLEALFGMIAPRYDLLLLDLPATWFAWTGQVISVCDLAVVTGLNTVPGLRQVAATLAAVRALTPAPGQMVVALNRCVPALFGGIAGRAHVKRVLGQDPVHLIRSHPSAATHALNTGVPIGVGSISSKISKDVGALAERLSGLVSARRSHEQ